LAAAYCAASAASLRVDAALPLNTVALQGILAPPLQSRFTLSENNSLLFDGISTSSVAQDGTVRIQRAVTTWQTNDSGEPDTSYRNVERLYTLQQVGRQFRSNLQTKYARKVLVIDGTPIPANSNMVTAQVIASEVVAVYNQLSNLGLVQDPTNFAKNILWCNAGNGQVSIMAPVNCANQLEIMAVVVPFTAS
jgi:phage tail sheath gpL-like